MKITELELAGLKLIELKKFDDARGFFTERFNKARFEEAGLATEFVQDNFSRSGPKVIRGLHFQVNPQQGKLVTCTHGEILDVVVDIRLNSPSFGRHASVHMSGNDCHWLWVPPGFAHGFCVLGEEPADVLYKVDNPYNPQGDRGVLWNDPDLKINWPIQNPTLSEKDLKLPTFKELIKAKAFQ